MGNQNEYNGFFNLAKMRDGLKLMAVKMIYDMSIDCCKQNNSHQHSRKIFMRSIFSQPNWPIIMQDSHRTCSPQLHLGLVFMLIGSARLGENRPN